MDDVKKFTIKVLQDLIDTNKDEYILFESASQKSEDGELKLLFAAYSCKKEEYISGLEKEIKRLGGCSETNKNDAKNSIEFNDSLLNGKTRDNLISEFLKMGDMTINKYFYAIKENIMWEVVPLIAKQYFGSKSLHDQIKNISMRKSVRLNQRTEIR
ncbi:MAG: PA2169 family four-helix-bundle protein [Ignavibacteriaceae bacterium]